MLIYTPLLTSRFSYVAHFILEKVSTAKIEITTDVEVFTNYSGVKILYAPDQFDASAFWIKPVDLLFEKGIRQQRISCNVANNGQHIFFKNEGDLGFDIFAATFFLLSRYEEYLPHEKDSYGRYAHQNSVAFIAGFLKEPLINTWIHYLKQVLRQKFPHINLPPAAFEYIPTYDIDHAWQYKHKGFLLNAGGYVKDLTRNDFNGLLRRLRVIIGNNKDPFDAYDWLDALHSQNNLQPYYFFLLANSRGDYDKNIDPGNTELQALITAHFEKYEIGIHPSWRSGDDSQLLQEEIQTLSSITGQQITHSRQHYIRMQLPDTYRRLLATGIRNDWSMGYGSINGFRASVAYPFYWYDLEKEETTNLLILPFCFMDANAFYEEHLTPSQALEEMQDMCLKIRKTGGTLVTIWHNNFLGQHPQFLEWKKIYHQWILSVAR